MLTQLENNNKTRFRSAFWRYRIIYELWKLKDLDLGKQGFTGGPFKQTSSLEEKSYPMQMSKKNQVVSIKSISIFSKNSQIHLKFIKIMFWIKKI